MNSKIVFSIPAHECVDCLEKQIENIISKVSNSFFVIFLSSNNEFNLNSDRLLKKYENRVFVNTESRPTFWGDCFYQHYSNYKFIKSINFNFDYWCFEASNSFLLKDGLDLHISDYDALATSNRDFGITPKQKNFNAPLSKSSKWWDSKFYNDKKFMKLVRSNNFQIYNGFVEGMVFKKEIAEEIHEILEFYDCTDYKLNSSESYPREEVYFQTLFFNKFADCNYTHTYCNLYSNIESLEFILKSFKGFYAVKPSPRNLDSPIYIEHQEIAKLGFDKYFYLNKQYEDGQKKYFFTDDFLIGKTFEYCNKQGKLGDIKFLPNGAIDLFKHHNEEEWKVDKFGDLYFLDNNGVITTIFYANKDDNFYGNFWHKGKKEGYQWHILKLIK